MENLWEPATGYSQKETDIYIELLEQTRQRNCLPEKDRMSQAEWSETAFYTLVDAGLDRDTAIEMLLLAELEATL